MKLLIYSHYFAPSVGGVESIALSLGRGLAALRTPAGAAEFDVVVATQTLAKGYDDSALPFRVVRRPRLRYLWKLVRNSDVVHLAGPSIAPLFLARISRRPLVLEHHGYQAVCPNGLLLQHPNGNICPNHFLRKDYAECYRCLAKEGPPLQRLKALLLMFPRYFLARRASANVAITNHVRERCALPRSSTIYYGVDDQPEKVPAIGSPSALPGEICFAYVGRLVAEKGLATLIEAAHMLSQTSQPFQLLLVGDGPERPKLEGAITGHHLESRVQITGFLTGAALSQTLRGVDVVVMPSIWEETAGLAAIEQMMRGRLVIVSDVGGLAEVVGEAGIKFPLGDAPALAEAMQRVLSDPSLIALCGARARQRAVGLFRQERMVADHARLYRELAAKSDGKSDGKSA